MTRAEIIEAVAALLAEARVEAIRRGADVATGLAVIDRHLERIHAAADGWPSHLEQMARSLMAQRTSAGWTPPEFVPREQLRLIGEDDC